MRHTALAAVSVLAAALFSPSVFAEPVQIETARGAVTLQRTPKAVAVYNGAAIDTLNALGVPLAGVPEKLYAADLEKAGAGAAHIGTLFEADLEALSSLQPDLIVVGGRSASQFDSVSRVAATIDMTISADLVADARARLLAYGVLFEREARAQEMAQALDARLAQARAAAQGKGNALIVMTNGPKISAFGSGSRFGWIHDALDIPQAHERLTPEKHGDAISFEFIAQTDPDWLFVIDRSTALGRDGPSAQQTLDTPLVAGTKAARANHIVYLDPAPLYISGGGYHTIMTTLDQLITAFSGT